MNDTKQFRCPKCLRLLFKYDKKNDKVLYQAINIQFEPDEKNRAAFVTCNKCGARCAVKPEGLVEARKEINHAMQ